MPIMRKIVKLAVGYALTKALARHGGPKGLLDAVMSSANGSRGRDGHRGNDGPQRYKRDGKRRRDY